MTKSPGDSKGSNHYFTLTWHREKLRGYCIGCSNYRVLFYYLNREHYCASCKGKINSALKKRKVDISQIDRRVLDAHIDEVVEAIQRETADDKKFTERDYRISSQKWRTKRR